MLKELGKKVHIKTTMSLVKLIGLLLKMHPAYKTDKGKLQLAIGFLKTLKFNTAVKILLNSNIKNSNVKNSAVETHKSMLEKTKQKFLH